MTKQDKIREGIRQRIMNPLAFVDLEDIFIPEVTIPRLILEYLHSQGVVIKIDRELTKIQPSYDKFVDRALRGYRQRIKNAGYIAVEPLIKL